MILNSVRMYCSTIFVFTLANHCATINYRSHFSYTDKRTMSLSYFYSTIQLYLFYTYFSCAVTRNVLTLTDHTSIVAHSYYNTCYLSIPFLLFVSFIHYSCICDGHCLLCSPLSAFCSVLVLVTNFYFVLHF